MTQPILVTGATGLQGGAVVDSLLAHNQPVRALSRHPDGKNANALKGRGVEVVGGDFNDDISLRRACDGVKAVFSVQDFYAEGVGQAGEVRQAKALISAALEANVPHLVQSVMGDAVSYDGVPHFLSKNEIETTLKTSGLSYTLLGTVWFMDNLLNPEMRPNYIFPTLSGSLQRDTAFYMLAISDLGETAAKALVNPQKFRNKKINMVGDILTVEQMRKLYKNTTGLKSRPGKIPNWILRFFASEFASQLKWHNRVNFNFTTEQLSSILENPVSFTEYLLIKNIKTL